MAEEQLEEPEKASEKLSESLAAIENNGVETIIPVEAARAHLRHWWREPLSGLLALGIGTFDAWRFPRDEGLSISLDEILVIGGIVLIAGSRRLFSPPPPALQKIATEKATK